MNTVMYFAWFLSLLLGQNFDREWACWEDLVNSHTPYVCEYSGPQPLHIFVWSNDGVEVHTSIDSLENGQ